MNAGDCASALKTPSNARTPHTPPPTSNSSNNDRGVPYTPGANPNFDIKTTPQFSPLPLTPSPSNVTGKGLQGTAKVIRNGVADLTNFTLKWKELSQKSYNQFEKVLEQIASYEDEAKPPLKEVFDEVLNKLCTEICGHLDEMEILLKSMTQILTRFENCVKLAESQKEMEAEMFEDSFSSSSCEDQVLFYSWKLHKFADCCKTILAEYQTQTRLLQPLLKQAIYSAEKETNARDLHVLLLSAWLHNPYITDEADSNLLMMQIETGLVSF